jgi:hypothetical protein
MRTVSRAIVRWHTILVFSLCVVTSSIAGIRLSNTIDPLVLLSEDGRHLVVTGPITCPVDDRVRIRVTITQRTTGAIAEGITHVVCTGEPQEWVAELAAHGKEVFLPGAATAVAFGRTTNPVESPDAHQWLVNVELHN